MIDRAASGDPDVLRLLGRHPGVAQIADDELPGIRFFQGPWQREVIAGDSSCELKGLVELLDNNPMVCADRVSVPDPVSTLALIGLGPLALAGMIAEPPSVLTNLAADSETVGAFLSTAGWDQGASVASDQQNLGGAAAASVMAAIKNPESFGEIDEMYEERFGRSFYVRRAEEGAWDIARVIELPFALYRLRLTPDEPISLLTIQVMADLRGKCGAAQLVHAMNVMAGMEESLGIE